MPKSNCVYVYKDFIQAGENFDIVFEKDFL